MEQNIILSRKRITLYSSSNFCIIRANKLLVSTKQCFWWISGKIRKWFFLNEGMDFSKAGNGFSKIRDWISWNQDMDFSKSGNVFSPQSVNLFPKIRECISRNDRYISQNQGMYLPKRGNAPKLDSRRVRKPALAAESSSPPATQSDGKLD